MFAGKLGIFTGKITPAAEIVSVCESINPMWLCIGPNNMVLVPTDQKIRSLEQRNQPAALRRVLDYRFQNLTTPPPRSLPIERWIARQKLAQSPDDVDEPFIFGAGITFGSRASRW